MTHKSSDPVVALGCQKRKPKREIEISSFILIPSQEIYFITIIFNARKRMVGEAN